MYIITLTITAIIVWAWSNPQAARALVARLKRHWRAYLIRRHERRAALSLFKALRTQADRQGIDPTLVEEFIQAHALEVAIRLGREEANRLLGEPTPLERFS